MTHEVIMPALGMAQDTGTIVQWHKQPGDAVKANDILMEIETDKTTVEIEAGCDGFLTTVLVEVNTPVPVGSVVAVVENQRAVSAAPPPPIRPSPAVRQASQPTTANEPAPQQTANTSAPGLALRILASPKARVLASEHSIDLKQLVAQGVPQPYHAIDIERAITQRSNSAPSAALSAQVAADAIESLHTWLARHCAIEIAAANIWAAFFAASVRASGGLADEKNNPVMVSITQFGTKRTEQWTVADPDLCGFSRCRKIDATTPPPLQIFDLTATPLSEYCSGSNGSDGTLTLCIGQGASEHFSLRLEFSSQYLPVANAVAILDELTRRAEQPLRQLL